MNSPVQICQNYKAISIAKASMGVLNMLLLGVLAGMFIALAGVGSVFGNALVSKVMGAAIFPAGLAMVVVAGSELFTGNCLMIASVFNKDITVLEMLKNWLFVYIGNMIGAMLVAFLTVKCGTFSAESVQAALASAASGKVALSFASAFIKGIFCNFLVCIAVWMAFAATSVPGKIMGVFFPVFLFVLCGFEHSVANMFYIPAGIFSGVEGVNWVGFFVSNLIPVTLGNIVGGCFVATMYWVVYQRPM